MKPIKHRQFSRREAVTLPAFTAPEAKVC